MIGRNLLVNGSVCCLKAALLVLATLTSTLMDRNHSSGQLTYEIIWTVCACSPIGGRSHHSSAHSWDSHFTNKNHKSQACLGRGESWSGKCSYLAHPGPLLQTPAPQCMLPAHELSFHGHVVGELASGFKIPIAYNLLHQPFKSAQFSDILGYSQSNTTTNSIEFLNIFILLKSGPLPLLSRPYYLFLDILYKWDHITCGLLYLISFTKVMF